MEKVVVTAPYVMLKVKDVSGGVTVRDFYKDAVLPDGSNAEDVERLIGKGMLARQEVAFVEPEPPAPAIGVMTLDEKPEGGPELVKPAPADNKAAWVEYAVALRGEGVLEAEARAAAEAMSKADLAKRYQ